MYGSQGSQKWSENVGKVGNSQKNPGNFRLKILKIKENLNIFVPDK